MDALRSPLLTQAHGWHSVGLIVPSSGGWGRASDLPLFRRTLLPCELHRKTLTPALSQKEREEKEEPAVGVEPTRAALRERCSANRAAPASVVGQDSDPAGFLAGLESCPTYPREEPNIRTKTQEKRSLARPRAVSRAVPPDLARVVDAWPNLPEATRQAILALCKE
jgi:hypothetical protein